VSSCGWVPAPYEIGTTPAARRALAEKLPPEVAVAAAEFIIGPLLNNPCRVGEPLGEELTGIYSARLGRLYRGARSTTPSTAWSCWTSGAAAPPTGRGRRRLDAAIKLVLVAAAGRR
jgi:hypothetical protein